jgi:hypothetical protein
MLHGLREGQLDGRILRGAGRRAQSQSESEE